MAIHFDTMRVGKKYYLINDRETSEFQVEEKIGKNNFKLKDLNTLEYYTLHDLIKYGIAKDFDLYEITPKRG